MKPDGGPAFPYPHYEHQDPGMSLRDWFAGMALIGLMARLAQPSHKVISEGWREAGSEADLAYKIADAMLKEREKP